MQLERKLRLQIEFFYCVVWQYKKCSLNCSFTSWQSFSFSFIRDEQLFELFRKLLSALNFCESTFFLFAYWRRWRRKVLLHRRILRFHLRLMRSSLLTQVLFRVAQRLTIPSKTKRQMSAVCSQDEALCIAFKSENYYANICTRNKKINFAVSRKARRLQAMFLKNA